MTTASTRSNAKEAYAEYAGREYAEEHFEEAFIDIYDSEKHFAGQRFEELILPHLGYNDVPDNVMQTIRRHLDFESYGEELTNYGYTALNLPDRRVALFHSDV